MVAVAMATLTILLTSEFGTNRLSNFVSYPLAATIGLASLCRHRAPLGALMAVAAATLSYYLLGEQHTNLASVLAVVAYFAAARGRLRPTLVASTLWITAATVINWFQLGGQPWVLTGELPNSVVIVGLAIALGDAVHSRRLVHQQQAAQARQLVQRERLRIARDVHDVLAHNVAVVSVQASVASEAVDRDPKAALAALGAIRTANSTALDDLRSLLRLLRDDDVDVLDHTPSAGLANLPELTALASTTDGLNVRTEIHGAAVPLPAAVESTAYRIVQEALTNVIKHAKASKADIHLTYTPDALIIEVRDNGIGGTPQTTRGIAGMQARAQLFGGSVRAAQAGSGGFSVRAHLPLRRAP
jgi:signal transduction histidine kinase